MPFAWESCLLRFLDAYLLVRVCVCVCVCVCARAQSLSCVPLFATSRTVAHQAPLSIEFPRQEYWSGLPLLTPGVLPHPGIEPVSPTSLALAGAVRVAEYSFLCYTFSSVQSLSGVQLCDPMDCSTPGLPVHHQRPEFTQTHVR